MSETGRPSNVVVGVTGNEGEIERNIFPTYNTNEHYFEQGNEYYYGIKKVLRIYTKNIYPLLNSDIPSLNSIVDNKKIKSVTFEYEVKSSDTGVTFENIGILTNGAKSSEGNDTRNYYNLGYIYITGYKPELERINIDMPYTYTMKFGEDVDPIVIKGIVYDTINIGKEGVCDAIDCQSYYRPFYYNALLLLTPTGFTKNSEYTMNIPKEIKNEEELDVVDSSAISPNHLYNITTTSHTTNDQTVCYGRLFYSIANGLSIKDNAIYTLDNVTLQTIVGNETNVMKLNKPFRNYSEMSHSTSGETFAEDITGSTKTTKMMMYGITEPFTKKNGKYERGVPIVKTIDSIDIEGKIYDNKISNANTINDDFNVPIGDIVFNNLTANTLDTIEYTTVQTLNVSGMSVVTFDTSQPMSVAFSVTEGHLMGEEGETIASYYNGIKFYDNIYVDKINEATVNGTTFHVDGYSSRNIRYFAIQTRDGEGYSITNYNELVNLLRGIYYMGPIANGYEKHLQYDGINCNEYLKSRRCDSTVVYRSGWRDIHTSLKRNDNGYILELSDNEPCGRGIENDAPIDITSILNKAQRDGAYQASGNEYSNGYRIYIVGIYSEYTRLSEDEYEEEKVNMYSVIKKHVPKFSVVKLYKLQEKTENSSK